VAETHHYDTQVVWERFSNQLRSFISKRVTSRDDSEDILQDVFVRIHAKLHTLRNAERLTPWLYKITRNAITDHYRQQQRLSELPVGFDVEGATGEPDAETRLAARLRIMVIDFLPNDYARALVMSDLEGLTQQEIARRSGLSLSGAKSRVQRARHMLRDMLLKCCHFEFDRRGRVIDYSPLPTCPCLVDSEKGPDLFADKKKKNGQFSSGYRETCISNSSKRCRGDNDHSRDAL